MNKNVTMIALSRVKYTPETIPANCEYHNYVSIFDSYADAVRKMLKTIGEINTPYYFFCDDDDAVPLYVPTPENGNGVLYGDLIVEHSKGGSITTVKGRPWSAAVHMRNPFLTHKCVGSTQATLKLAELLPTEGVWFEFVYHFFLADCFGAQYNPQYKYIWTKHNQAGMHYTHPPLRDSSLDWIKKNRQSVRAAFGL